MTKPTLPPEVEKEFREIWVDGLFTLDRGSLSGKLFHCEDSIESFFARVIAKEVEKAKAMQIKIDSYLVEDTLAAYIKSFDIHPNSFSAKMFETGINKIRSQLTHKQ